MLAVLVGTTLMGLWKGMAWQIASLCAVFVSAAVAIHCSAPLATYFSAHEPWNRWIAILVLYVVTAGAIWLVFRLVSGVIDRVKLKEFDRQLGGMFGLAKGILYCVILTFFAVTLSESLRQSVLQSRSGDFIARGIHHANPILPDDVRTWIGQYIDELDAKLRDPPKEGDPPAGRATPDKPQPAPVTTGGAGGVGGSLH